MFMTKRVIMLSGFKDAGKDTTANLIKCLLEARDTTVHDVALAKPIKKVCSELFGIDFDILDGKTAENRAKREEVDSFWSRYISGFTPRNSLTMLGTDILRKELFDDIWIVRCLQEILNRDEHTVLITDLREPNEEFKIREFGRDYDIEVIHLNVKRYHPSWFSLAVQAYDGHVNSVNELERLGVHSSEWKQVGLMPDYVIHNEREDYVANITRQLKAYHI